MIRVTDKISIPETELHWQFIRASGPGGQNVNKVSSAVELRFDVARTHRLNSEVKSRLRKLAGHRMSADGVLVIQAQRYRSQARNRDDALQRLVALVRSAAKPTKVRKPTAPSAAAKRRRVEEKKKRAIVKSRRAAVRDYE
ncbi:MAG: aminoacyl-tRNA hydrolase [Betaproteobacteria bacterium]|nr:MAG: aminoacyl-tRNA hydrolase [Betaproteobacteria bacterium]